MFVRTPTMLAPIPLIRQYWQNEYMGSSRKNRKKMRSPFRAKAARRQMTRTRTECQFLLYFVPPSSRDARFEVPAPRQKSPTILAVEWDFYRARSRGTNSF